MADYSSITFDGEQTEYEDYIAHDIESEVDAGSTVWRSAPSMGVHPIISQYSSGGMMSRQQANAIMAGGMDYEFSNYGMSNQEIHQAKQAFEMHIASGSVKLI
ncbi:hypothetical protein [Parendozoicomonas haliclonae]|uniref:Uncharacterized protein n=1 Tax=Parendozoicomonas haliclonae TaxID=1960125 RepID=A0A1X7AMI6_9GAMM|nr:hypothetical protein [Parendozoicomonas haliclonae]SMA47367.1 hypothetical protein EHSB41UT_02387 [Parendozoicomonas haliclonae]